MVEKCRSRPAREASTGPRSLPPPARAAPRQTQGRPPASASSLQPPRPPASGLQPRPISSCAPAGLRTPTRACLRGVPLIRGVPRAGARSCRSSRRVRTPSCTGCTRGRSSASPWAPELTRTPQGLRWVRTGYACQPPALGTYWVRVPASGAPYVPRTVPPQVVTLLTRWSRTRASSPHS